MHDPLCPARHKKLFTDTICTHCSLIRATRADERRKQWPDPHQDMYLLNVEGRPE